MVVRKYYPHGCPALPAGQLARRSSAPAESSISLLPGKKLEVGFKGPWTDADGKQVLFLPQKRFSLISVDANGDVTYDRLSSNRSQIVKHL